MTTESTVTAASASRRGTRPHNCDSAAIHHMPGTAVVAAALVDGIGNSDQVAEFAHIAAEVAARVGPRKTATLGILAAAELVAAPAAADIEPDGVAVLALVEPGQDTAVAWTGDARAYGFDGATLTRRTTDHTVGQYLRINGGVAIELCEAHDNWIRASLGRSSIATVHAAEVPDTMIVLTSDGVHDSVAHDDMQALARAHHHDPQALADALVAAAVENAAGYRDDATAIVVTTR
ncbi:SpoIIE family protein phosphatase [Streptomyces sp. SID3343]|uniref:SpoIIE family protein phosphatase n=1 Tax=Streptomyces sp. SID3343 TaxID=2690260 RepID=UPI00136C75E2|nr:SpoIIE family protein phosphatase [Streptomyces sp. SID3343]MYW04800.1 SpoIIE family protein phosphatase [Streptomyces sp. SID3343]